MKIETEGICAEVTFKKIKGIYLRVDPAEGRVRMNVPIGTSQDEIIKILQEKKDWILSRRAMPAATEEQKELMRERLKELIPYWEKKMGLHADHYILKSMKSRWGSCNPLIRQITLNLELAALPEECLCYVLVHELAHMVYLGHGKEFWALVEQYIPDWKRIRRSMRE